MSMQLYRKYQNRVYSEIEFFDGYTFFNESSDLTLATYCRDNTHLLQSNLIDLKLIVEYEA